MTSELIANDDPVKAERARKLLRAAAKAADQFEENVRELVSMRAWAILGYQSFPEMWEAENGFECPKFAKVLVVAAMDNEGLNTRTGSAMRVHGPNGHTTAEVANAAGYPVNRLGHAPRVGVITRQLKEGVPPQHVTVDGRAARVQKTIDSHGTRARSRPRRTGATLDDNVVEGFSIARRYADAANEHARQMGVPKSEVYRQAVIEYLDRNGVNAHYGQAPNGATPEFSG